MRQRPIAALATSLVIALSMAACGGSDEAADTAEPTSGQISTPAPPVQAGSTPDDGTATDPAGDADLSGGGGKETTKGERRARRKASGESIPVVASRSTDLTNFTTALGASGLEKTLEEGGPYTVFAPNNDGFAKLGTRLDSLLQPASKAELVNILSFHVVRGSYTAKDLRKGELLTTLQGSRLRVGGSPAQRTIGNAGMKASITSTDLKAGNGVVHVIDTVLIPKT